MSAQPDSAFAEHRALLFKIAYNLTGSVSDAEDVVQECYLRWRAVETPVAHPRSYLAQIATRQALNALRKRNRQREDYPGVWLPEPLPTAAQPEQPAARSPESALLLADQVSTAMLVMLQSLNAEQRAAFVLREVFDFDYPEIARALGKSPEAVRQLVHRARTRVRSGRRHTLVDDDTHRATVEGLFQATMGGDIQTLMDVLAPDVVVLSDGGGHVSTARKPIVGADPVARFLHGLARKHAGSGAGTALEINGRMAMLFYDAQGLPTLFQFEVADARVTQIYILRNPRKLAHLT
ncbi:RNA polymerase subunit sigma-24 [Lujinxingia litoralis]|uniref:RNA polymerase subunit sigma-24 n=1 Tax=Lujinxingia litoralis TaxID=2211119 RepID=A0A328C6H0_9DELT|nr:RNA polymerase sigma factor SigJ [Lujinxingia litoralis]RAL22158.1 RNA polymerase subunit sigma-24 [Lujinxingia litoralis]